jgi:hypothetical protein
MKLSKKQYGFFNISSHIFYKNERDASSIDVLINASVNSLTRQNHIFKSFKLYYPWYHSKKLQMITLNIIHTDIQVHFPNMSTPAADADQNRLFHVFILL